jgi:hypothetical protein
MSSNSNGTRSVYSRKNPKSSLYCEMSMGSIRSNALVGYARVSERTAFSADFLSVRSTDGNLEVYKRGYTYPLCQNLPRVIISRMIFNYYQ